MTIIIGRVFIVVVLGLRFDSLAHLNAVPLSDAVPAELDDHVLAAAQDVVEARVQPTTVDGSVDSSVDHTVLGALRVDHGGLGIRISHFDDYDDSSPQRANIALVPVAEKGPESFLNPESRRLAKVGGSPIGNLDVLVCRRGLDADAEVIFAVWPAHLEELGLHEEGLEARRFELDSIRVDDERQAGADDADAVVEHRSMNDTEADGQNGAKQRVHGTSASCQSSASCS
mmetsp:Transcript_17692/g.55394  ORF Transcript_17692/g.55394 Transcript_17692/m.55394 type:complete len:229 (+) Transcript_17692:18-704(+)